MEIFSDIGKYLRLPQKQIKIRPGEELENTAVIEAIADKIRENGRNFLPVIVEEVDEDEYEVLMNAHVLEAVRQANQDFVWCILADEKRRKQMEIESMQRFEVNILTASEQAIAGMLDYIKSTNPGWTQVDPKTAAQKIVENRQDSWKSFNPIAKLRCRIGRKKLTTLQNYFCIQ